MSVDLRALRTGRLERLQSAMRSHGVEAGLFFNPANVRYATGATTMTTYCLGSFVRCVLVPVEGRPVLFEHANSMHLFDGVIEAEVRPFHGWEFFDDPASEAMVWAGEIVAAMRERGVDAGRLAVDKLAPVAIEALSAEGVGVVESGTVTMDAREVKTAQEVELFERNGELVMDMLSAFEAAIEPDIRERDLVAVLTDRMLRGGGEYLITRGVASGPNTNPWRQEAGDRPLEPGDVVFVDTDVNGIEGYFSCVSRTFVCPSRAGEPIAPAPEQRGAYELAREWVGAAEALLRPGLSYEDYARQMPELPDGYRAQRYETMLHSCGLEDEGPSISYPDAGQTNPGRVLKEHMVVVSEVYLGEVGAPFGVKYGDQFLITADGARCLAPYPPGLT